jgi:hypothetical protein
MSITIDMNLAEDLINTKLKIIDEEINTILKRWNVDSIDELVDGCRQGKFDECENDAIDLTNLRDRRKELIDLLKGNE